MKNFLKCALLCSCSALYAQDFSEDKSGLLLGVSVLNIQTETQTNFSWSKSDLYPIGARIGYQKFSQDGVFGTRFYVDYHINNHKKEDQNFEIKQNLTSVNLDALFDYNIPNTNAFIGIFAGLHYTSLKYKELWNTSLNVEFKQSGIGFNIGAALTLAKRHRIEAYYKSLPYKKYESSTLQYQNDGLAGLAYQYNF